MKNTNLFVLVMRNTSWNRVQHPYTVQPPSSMEVNGGYLQHLCLHQSRGHDPRTRESNSPWRFHHI